MNRIAATIMKAAAVASALTAVAAPAMAHDWRDRDRYGYDRGDPSYEWDRRGRLRGDGVGELHPYLRETWEGRQFVVRVLGTGHVSNRGARIANREFYRSGRHDRRYSRWERKGGYDGRYGYRDRHRYDN